MNEEILALMKKYKGDGVGLGREKAEAVISEYVRYPERLHDNQYSALVSFIDNVGSSVFITSKVLRLLNGLSKTELHMVPDAMMEWIAWGTGESPPVSASMKKRREFEAKIFKELCLVAHNLKPKKRA